VDRITGGRFALLTDYINDEETIKLPDAAVVEAKVGELERMHVKDKLEVLQLAHDHAFFKALVATKRITSDERRTCKLGQPALDALLKANIIAAHPDGSYTFHSRFVERYFEKVVAAAAAAAAAPAITGAIGQP
jgi:hypothetical protein